MLLPSVSFSAAGFLGIAVVTKPVERASASAVGSAHPRAGACRPLHGHPRARAQGGKTGEGPPALSHRASRTPALPVAHLSRSVPPVRGFQTLLLRQGLAAGCFGRSVPPPRLLAPSELHGR